MKYSNSKKSFTLYSIGTTFESVRDKKSVTENIILRKKCHCFMSSTNPKKLVYISITLVQYSPLFNVEKILQ